MSNSDYMLVCMAMDPTVPPTLAVNVKERTHTGKLLLSLGLQAYSFRNRNQIFVALMEEIPQALAQ
jgi:hypothetical protein